MTETKTDQKGGTPKMASAGKSEVANIASIINPEPKTKPAEGIEKPAGTEGSDNGAGDSGSQGDQNDQQQNDQGQNQAGQVQVPEMTDDQLKELYEKRFKPAPEESPEQKAQKEAAFEKRLLDFYIENGGKGDDFYSIKTAAQAEQSQLADIELHRQLKEQGFNDKEINEIKVERYYQLNPDELEQKYEETEEEFAARKELVKKKVALGTERFNRLGAKLKTDAQGILDKLKEGVSQRDLQKQKETEFSAKVDEVAKNLSRKITLELGKLNDEDLGSVQIEASDEDVADIAATLKTPERINNILYTDSGDLNVEGLINLLLRNKLLEKAARESLFTGRTQQVAIFEKTFPARDPHSLGVGKVPSSVNGGRKGKIASAGKPVPINQPIRQITK